MEHFAEGKLGAQMLSLAAKQTCPDCLGEEIRRYRSVQPLNKNMRN
jgi:hypothetical protein